MSSFRKDSVSGTIIVALVLCLVCSVIVASAAVLLKPTQVRNSSLNVKENILRAANLISGPVTAVEIEEKFNLITPRIVDLETGEYVDPSVVGVRNAIDYDQFKAAKDPQLSKTLPGSEDLASIKRRERYALVYTIESEGKIDRVILPIRGYGLWSTLYGFIALEGDANTVVGLGFYQHAETPGLGGEVDNPNWKAQWPGKKVYNLEEAGAGPAIQLVKGSVRADDPRAQHQVDALAGATLTSRGVTNLLRYWLGEQGFQKYLERVRSREASSNV